MPKTLAEETKDKLKQGHEITPTPRTNCGRYSKHGNNNSRKKRKRHEDDPHEFDGIDSPYTLHLPPN